MEENSRMRKDGPLRLLRPWRSFWAFVVLFGVAGLVGEGIMEVGRLAAALSGPTSVPGESKLIEHFAFTHVLVPSLAIMLVFWPEKLRATFSSVPIRLYLVLLLVCVTVPETLISFRSDLFRPYPFNLPSWLDAHQIVRISGNDFNVIQFHHLLFSHYIVMGSLAAACISDSLRARFFGVDGSASSPRSVDADKGT
jgi:magnesium-transporting ATPase (P-type)